MADTYRAAIYKAFNDAADKKDYDTYYFQTYTDDAIESDNRKFITADQLSFISSLIDGGSGTAGTAYATLVQQVVDLETFKETIEGLLNDGDPDTDGTINKLIEILDFVSEAEIAEDTTLEEFISQFNQWTINGTSGSEAGTFWAPTGAGTAGEILVSGGAGNAPTWTNVLPVAQGGTGKTELSPNAILLGNGLGAVNELVPGAADTVLVSAGPTDGPEFKDKIKLASIELTGDGVTGADLIAVEAKTDIIRAKEIYELDVANPSDNVGKEIPAMKNAVMTSTGTPPNETDYARNYMVDGLIWIDTGSNPPETSEMTHTLTLFGVGKTELADGFKAFIEDYTKIPTFIAAAGDDAPGNPEPDASTKKIHTLYSASSGPNGRLEITFYRHNSVTDGAVTNKGISCLEVRYEHPTLSESITTVMLAHEGESVFTPVDFVIINNVNPNYATSNWGIESFEFTIPQGRTIINNLDLIPGLFFLKADWSVI